MQSTLLFLLGRGLEAAYWWRQGDEAPLAPCYVAPALDAQPLDGPRLAAMAEARMTEQGLDPVADRDGLTVALACRSFCADGEALAASLRERGFAAPVRLPVEQLQAASYRTDAPVVVASGDGSSLALSLFGQTASQPLAPLVLEGEGVDRRLLAAANVAWGKIHHVCPRMSRPAVFPQIVAAVAPLVAGLDSELTVSVSDGGFTARCLMQDTDFSVSSPSRAPQLLSAVQPWLAGAGLRTSQCAFMLGHGLSGSPWFEQEGRMLAPHFSDVVSFPAGREPQLLRRALLGAVPQGGLFALPRSHVSVRTAPDSVSLGVQLPPAAVGVRLMLEGRQLHVFPPSSTPERPFVVEPLVPGRAYTFSLVAEYDGGQCAPPLLVEARTEPLARCVELSLADSPLSADIEWQRPPLGEVRLYVSQGPFRGLEQRVVTPEVLAPFATLPVVDGHMARVQKDFCGERYVLPVVECGQMVSGSAVRLEGRAAPRGVRLVTEQRPVPRVEWQWDGLQRVRVRWDADGHLGSVDLSRADAPDAAFDLDSLPGGARELQVGVCALATAADGSEIQSAYEEPEAVLLRCPRFEFLEVKQKKNFWGRRLDEYEVAVRCLEGTPACDMIIIAYEGRTPASFGSYPALLTFPRERLAGRQTLRGTVLYRRVDKSLPLVFRLYVARESERKNVSYVSPSIEIN